MTNVFNKLKCMGRGIFMSGLMTVCILPGQVKASIETVYGSLPAALTSYDNAPIAVQQFDPSLGVLQSVTIAVSGSGKFTQYYQNTSTASGDTISVSQTLDMILKLGADTLLNLTQVNQNSYTVSAWNGNPPIFTGTAGGTQTYAVTAAGQTELTSADGLAAFSGSGSTDLLLSALAFGSVSDVNGGNFLGGSAVTAGANVSVAYEYSAVPEASTWVAGVGILAAVMIGGLIERRAKLRPQSLKN